MIKLSPILKEIKVINPELSNVIKIYEKIKQIKRKHPPFDLLEITNNDVNDYIFIMELDITLSKNYTTFELRYDPIDDDNYSPVDIIILRQRMTEEDYNILEVALEEGTSGYVLKQTIDGYTYIENFF